MLIVVGLVGTLLPILPGAILIFAGIVLGAWIDAFERVSPWIVAIAGALAILTFVADYVAGTLGAKRSGASPQAITGAAIGTLVGVFTGLWGLLFMPLVGAAIGEYLALRDLAQAGRIGVATAVGLLIGTAVKLALAFAMVGLFVAALFF